jgi:hypothetical protein
LSALAKADQEVNQETRQLDSVLCLRPTRYAARTMRSTGIGNLMAKNPKRPEIMSIGHYLGNLCISLGESSWDSK